jgi:hypothetical protein
VPHVVAISGACRTFWGFHTSGELGGLVIARHGKNSFGFAPRQGNMGVRTDINRGCP